MQHRHNAAFGTIQWFFWSGFGLIFAFLSAYYQDIGFTTVQIGLVMALVSTANIAGQPVLGLVADRIGAPGIVLRNALVVGIVLSVALFFTPPLLYPVAALSVLVSVSVQTLPPILDGWTMQVKERVPRLDYGLTRSMGSVGFAVTVALAGRIFDAHGIVWMFTGAAIMLGVTLVIVAFVSGSRGAGTHEPASSVCGATVSRKPLAGAHAGLGPATIREFFSRDMIALLLLTFAAFTAYRPVQVFLPVLMRHVGGSNRELGVGLSIMGISEVPFLVGFSFLIRRFRDTRIMLVAMIAFLLRIGIHGFATSPAFVMIAQGLQGPSFGLFLPASVHLLNRLAPRGTRTLAQSAGAIASFGLGSMSGSALGGYLVEWFGITRMYFVMSALMMVVIIVYVLLFIARPGSADRVREGSIHGEGQESSLTSEPFDG